VVIAYFSSGGGSASDRNDTVEICVVEAVDKRATGCMIQYDQEAKRNDPTTAGAHLFSCGLPSRRLRGIAASGACGARHVG
jgi:hypothetical protein